MERLFNMGFNIRNNYRDDKDIKVRRTEEIYLAIKNGSLKLLKFYINGQRDIYQNL